MWSLGGVSVITGRRSRPLSSSAGGPVCVPVPATAGGVKNWSWPLQVAMATCLFSRYPSSPNTAPISVTWRLRPIRSMSL